MTTIQDAIVAINADLLVLGAPPLDADQVECLGDPVFQDEAEAMLDDLCARVGITTEVLELGLQALRARASKSPAAEHELGYAYPTSPISGKVGKYSEGAYYLQSGGNYTGYPSFEAALAAARSGGTTPARWSMDHPLCFHLLSKEHAETLNAHLSAQEVAHG